MNDLIGKRVLVTGASKGLGAAIVRQLAEVGVDTAFTYLSDDSAASALVSEVERIGRRSVAYKADAKDFNKAGEVVEEVIKDLGGLDLLVCNAGFAVGAALAEMTEAEWDDVMDVSLKGTFNYIRAVSPHAKELETFKIVCVGSINGLRGRMGTVSYNVAKAGLVGLVKTAASELGSDNVNVNLVAPGFIETPSQEKTPQLIRDLVLKECAIKRLGQPSDIAGVVVFLLSEAARHITGEIIKVDAGQYL